jgi:HTH-type transcriptional regulator, transcriptional repressor of NAD biosynthesis genes
MRTGLTFGKFMPLHRGHQLLIETALAEVDELTIVVYDTHVPGGEHMPIAKRIGWIRDLYPQVANIVPLKDPFDGDPDEAASVRNAPAYAAQILEVFPGGFDRVFTSDDNYTPFAGLVTPELAADPPNHVVDASRSLVPISGTRIRGDLYGFRGWMDPLVYSSLIQKVVFVGTESTGKTTLAREMAKEFQTLWTHEFGRELWEAQNLAGTFQDHLKVARTQHYREEQALKHSRRYLFCDTNAWTTLMWCLNTYGTADSRLYDLAHDHADECVWILCANDFAFVDDGTRELGAAAAAFQVLLQDDLEHRRIPYHTVTGPLADRIEQVKEILAAPIGLERAYATADN